MSDPPSVCTHTHTGILTLHMYHTHLYAHCTVQKPETIVHFIWVGRNGVLGTPAASVLDCLSSEMRLGSYTSFQTHGVGVSTEEGWTETPVDVC